MLIDLYHTNSVEQQMMQADVLPKFVSSHHDYLSKHLRNIDMSNPGAWHFTSNGRFALHDIIVFVANRIGLCDVTISSFNISQEAARLFVRAYDKHLFSSLEFYLNASKKANFIKAIRIIENKFPINFINIHAKIALLSNEKHKIVILTSGNLSNNNNIERGVIFHNEQIYNYDREWLTNIKT